MIPKEQSGKHEKLTDYELAKLLDPELDQIEREHLALKLDSDPEAARLIGAAEGIELREGLDSPTISSLMDLVRKSKEPTGICPQCAGDLHAGGKFCPHCSARIEGNTLTCITCLKPIVDGSTYCPHCGSVFGEFKKRTRIDIRFMFLVIGLLLFLSVALVPSGKAILIAIGLLSITAWVVTIFMDTGQNKRKVDMAGTDEDSSVNERKQRKSG